MDIPKLDYRKIGLKVGLELHQQLNTKYKLFCKCPTILHEKPSPTTFKRYLRPTMSELGEVDVAALFEWKKGRYYIYEVHEDNVCLVESDEEPPHPLNMEAVEIALTVALMLHSRPVDEIHVMRKVVIDGSNTTGFQRTAIIALGGYIEDEDGIVRIQTICIEEDAARKVGEKGKGIQYRLDRLGIPLIEISTAPDIHTPEQAERVAFKIGQLLRMTGKVKRGLGTIRQDLNVSIEGGEKIEIKGVQRLDLIAKVVAYEALRQLRLLQLKNEILKRGIREEDIKSEFIDVSNVFKNTKSKIISRVLKSGGVVLALKLPKFKGLIGFELQPNRRFGTELADYARFWADVGGLFHTDELPAYGISREEVDKLYEVTGASKEDAIIIIADTPERARRGLEAVVERVKMAFKGVPKETRAANPDGTTRYMRPQPGAARMYPETDIPPVVIPRELIEKLKKNLPEPPNVKYEKYVKLYGLSSELAKEILKSYWLDLFEKLVEKFRNKVPATLIASTLVNTLKYLKSEGVPVENITDEVFEEVFKAYAEKTIAKEAIPEILTWIAKNPDKTVREAIKALGIVRISVADVEKIVENIMKSNIENIKSRGKKAFKYVMGLVMRELRGKVEGRIVAEIVERKLRELL